MSEQQLSLPELRTRRRELQDSEDAVSFVRRIAQGRLDLAEDEQRRRASGDSQPAGSLADRLAEIFGQQHGGGSARPPRETNVPSDHPLMQQLDDLCEQYQFESLDTIDDRGLADLVSGLSMFEKECSRQRHELFEQIDALTAELVRRVRESGAGAVIGDS